MDFLDGVRVFVATVETGSFAGAGDRLGISGKLASKYLGELEQRLDARLLQRTTRKSGMTAAGERFYARVPGWLDELDEIRGEIQETGRGLAGTLRISAPVTFGEMHLERLLLGFRAVHPDVDIDLRLSDSFVDLAAEGVDVAVRIGELSNSALVARKLGQTTLLLVASPAYLNRRGVPEKLDDLAGHDCICDTNLRSKGGWLLNSAGKSWRVAVKGKFLVNSARAVRSLCAAGEGIALCPDYVVSEDLRLGRLQHLLCDAAGPRLDIHAVYLPGKRMPRRVRAFLDFLAEARFDFENPG